MIGQFEGWRMYETVAEVGVPYPTMPAAPDIDTKILAAPSVWYVKELVNPEYDETLGDPTISSDDTGKFFNMFNMGNGPVLGDFASVEGLGFAYLPEGTRMAGTWYNGQLFGMPLIVDAGGTYSN